MDKKKLESFKKRLETRQHELRRMVSRTEQDGRTVDEDSAQDIADRAASSYTKEFLFHQSNNDRQLLQMVEGALSRIREGSFGECISCGKEINAKRLEAVPWTRHCIECQEKAEQGLLEETHGECMEWAAGFVRRPFSLPGSGEVRILRARTPPTSLGAGSSLRWKERGASG